MAKNVPVYLLFLVSIFAFGLGLVVSPYMNMDSSPLPFPPDDGTVSVTVAPGQPSLQCNWCGNECVELGSRTHCPDMPIDSNSWCGPVTADDQQVCQATIKEDKISCDANNACDSDESCYSYAELGSGRCVGVDEDPCQFCSSGKCEVSPETIYPPNVVCQ